MVAERLDTLAMRIIFILVTDEESFKIFTAIHNESFLCLHRKINHSFFIIAISSVLDAYILDVYALLSVYKIDHIKFCSFLVNHLQVF